jgi:hypothetical protein
MKLVALLLVVAACTKAGKSPNATKIECEQYRT